MNIQEIFCWINENICLGDPEGNTQRMNELAWWLNCHCTD